MYTFLSRGVARYTQRRCIGSEYRMGRRLVWWPLGLPLWSLPPLITNRYLFDFGTLGHKLNVSPNMYPKFLRSSSWAQSKLRCMQTRTHTFIISSCSQAPLCCLWSGASLASGGTQLLAWGDARLQKKCRCWGCMVWLYTCKEIFRFTVDFTIDGEPWDLPETSWHGMLSLKPPVYSGRFGDFSSFRFVDAETRFCRIQVT